MVYERSCIWFNDYVTDVDIEDINWLIMKPMLHVYSNFEWRKHLGFLNLLSTLIEGPRRQCNIVFILTVFPIVDQSDDHYHYDDQQDRRNYANCCNYGSREFWSNICLCFWRHHCAIVRHNIQNGVGADQIADVWEVERLRGSRLKQLRNCSQLWYLGLIHYLGVRGFCGICCLWSIINVVCSVNLWQNKKINDCRAWQNADYLEPISSNVEKRTHPVDELGRTVVGKELLYCCL